MAITPKTNMTTVKQNACGQKTVFCTRNEDDETHRKPRHTTNQGLEGIETSAEHECQAART